MDSTKGSKKVRKKKRKENYKYICSYIYNNNYPFIKEKRIINIYANVDMYL